MRNVTYFLTWSLQIGVCLITSSKISYTYQLTKLQKFWPKIFFWFNILSKYFERFNSVKHFEVKTPTLCSSKTVIESLFNVLWNWRRLFPCLDNLFDAMLPLEMWMFSYYTLFFLLQGKITGYFYQLFRYWTINKIKLCNMNTTLFSPHN